MIFGEEKYYGYTPTEGWYYLSSGGRYDPDSDTWTGYIGGRSIGPSARAYHNRRLDGGDGTHEWDNKMIVWGGFGAASSERSMTAPGTIRLRMMGSQDPLDRHETPAAAPPPVPACGRLDRIENAGLGWHHLDDYPYSAFSDGGSYDPSSDGWTALQTTGAPTQGSSLQPFGRVRR